MHDPQPAPRRQQRARRRGHRRSSPVWPSRLRSPRRWRRSSTRRTASSRSASSTALAGTTTPRQPHRMPRSPRSAASTDVVLIAGGRNKGLDLASMAAEHERVQAVVALGEAAPIIARRVRRVVPGRRGRVDARPPSTAAAASPGPATPCCCRRLRQLRLVSRRRLPGARRRLQAARPRTTSEADASMSSTTTRDR